jgi:hypothetical protein
MSLIIPANTLASGGFAVDNSLRFNRGSSDLFNVRTSVQEIEELFTISVWVKKATDYGSL